MKSGLSRSAAICALALWCGTQMSAQTFDDPASALASPQVDGVYAFNSAGYTIAGPAMSCSASSADVNDVWLCYVAAASGIVQFTVCPSSPVTGGSITPSDSAMALWDANGPSSSPGAELDCQDGGGSCGVGQSVVNYNVTAGTLYYVQVQNWGSVAAISGNLAIGLLPPPGVGDDCSTAYAQVGPGVVPLVATTSVTGGSANCAGGPDLNDQWIAYTATLTGVAYASTCGASVNAPGGTNAGIFTYLAAYTTCPAGAFTDIVCDDGSASPCGFGGGGEISFPVTAGTTYYIQIGDWNAFAPVAGVSVAINEAVPPAPVFADDCSTATVVIEGVHGYDSTGFTVAGPVASCSASSSDPNDCWLLYTPTASGIATFSNCASSSLAPGGTTTIGTDTFIAVWDASTCPPTVEIGCADGSPNCGVGPSEVSIGVCAGTLYYVQVGNWGSPAFVSGAVAIAVNPGGGGGGAGPGDDPSVAVAAAAPGVTPYNSAGFTSAGPAASCSAIGGSDVFDYWMTFVAPITGTAIASNCPSSALAPGGSASPNDTYLAAYSGSPCGIPGGQLVCADGSPDCGVGESEVQFQVIAGQSYFVQVGTWGSATPNSGAVSLAFIVPPTNDDCGTAIPLSYGANGPFSNVGATPSSPQGSCGLGADNDVWFSFFATCTGNMIVSTCGSNLDTWISVWDNCPGLGVEVACNDDDQATCGVFGPSNLSIPITAGTTYYINVAGWGNAQGNFTLNISCTYIHSWTVPSGPASIQLENVDGPPNALAYSAITLDVLHPGLQPAVSFPNGWFYGVPMGFIEVAQQVTWPGGLPFVGFLDGTGYMLNFTLPAGSTTALAGATLWSVGVAYDPLTGFASVGDTTDPTSFTL
jgi:hypothetical protein